MQEVEFAIEIVIGDDASTDQTPTLLRNLANRDSRIRLIHRQRNIGLVPNFYSTMSECRGRYVAVLDGDDFWTYPYKLQRQLSLLKETQAVLCFHSCRLLSEKSGALIPGVGLSKTFYSDPIDLDQELINVSTASAMFDKNALPEIPREYTTLFNQDAPLWMLLSARGGVCYIPEAWSVYRVHPHGIWSSISDIEKSERLAETTKTIATVLGKEPDARAGMWKSFFQRRVKRHMHQTILNRVSCGRWKAARRDVWQYLWGSPCPRFVPPRGHWGLYLRILLGRPSSLMKKYGDGNSSPPAYS